MNYYEKADNLLVGLSRHIGLKEPQHLDKYGETWLVSEGKKFLFRLNEIQRELTVSAYIAPLSGENTKKLVLRELLSSNFFWANTGGGVLGLDNTSGWICLSNTYKLDSTAENAFNSSFLRILGLVKYWRNLMLYLDVDGDTASSMQA